MHLAQTALPVPSSIDEHAAAFADAAKSFITKVRATCERSDPDAEPTGEHWRALEIQMEAVPALQQSYAALLRAMNTPLPVSLTATAVRVKGEALDPSCATPLLTAENPPEPTKPTTTHTEPTVVASLANVPPPRFKQWAHARPRKLRRIWAAASPATCLGSIRHRRGFVEAV